MKRYYLFLIMSVALTTSLNAMDLNSNKNNKGTKFLPREEQIKLAQSAGPSSITEEATIMVYGDDGKLVEAKKGTNNFVCIPDIDEQDVPDPICADNEAVQWINDLLQNLPRPTNKGPGIAYMAKGGWHWEKDGKVVMNKNEAGTTRVKEPPHWMILWPFDAKTSGLPSAPSDFGTYIMFENTPYAHLMIYQDPNQMK